MLERLRGPRRLRVLGTARGAVHLDLGGFVVSLLAPGIPRLPNAVVVARPAPGTAVGWPPAAPPAWSPRVPPLRGGPAAAAALARFLEARAQAPDMPVAEAADRLLGRGPGLTPEGDDVLAGAALGARALGPAAGLSPGAVEALVRMLVPPGAGARTTALSATLLDLAARGAGPEPLARLVAGPPAGREAALADLRRLGASTGAALAGGLLLAAREVLRAARTGVVTGEG